MSQLSRMRNRVQLAYIALKYLYESQSSFRRLLIKSGLGVALVVALLKLSKRLKKLLRVYVYGSKSKRKHRGGVSEKNAVANPSLNRQFLVEITYLLKLMFPRWLSKQSMLFVVHTLTLVARTFLSIYVARLEGLLVRNIVEQNFRLFWIRLVQWLLIAVPATTCNSLIRYLESKLDLELKAQLIKRLKFRYIFVYASISKHYLTLFDNLIEIFKLKN